MKTITWPRWTTIVALLLVPMLVAGGFLWGTWNANPRLRTVKAAIVNLDEMVEINGQKMPLGRQLSAELVNSDRDQNLTWVLADAPHAAKGLTNGTYAAVVTIPKDFSAKATSFSGAADRAQQATIHVVTSPVTGVSETALGQHIADSAANALNRFLTAEYLKNIYIGFNTMGEQFAELRDGTAQLADGARQLSDGTSQAASGSTKLTDGLRQAADGGAPLRSGIDQLAAGADQLASGTHALAGGTTQWAAGAREWSAGADRYTTGLGTYADGVQRYTDGVNQYVGVVNPVVKQVRDLVGDLPDWGDLVVTIDAFMARLPGWSAQLTPQVETFVPQLKAALVQLDALVGQGQSLENALDAFAAQLSAPATCPSDLAATPGACEAYLRGVQDAQARAKAALAPLLKQADALVASGAGLHDTLVVVQQAADQTLALVRQFAAWVPDAQRDWAAIKAQIPGGELTRASVLGLLDQFADGGDQLVSGGASLADGADGLTAGARQLADGASGLASGATQIAGGTTELAGGADQLAGGLHAYAAGIGQYTDGVAQAASGSAQLSEGMLALASGSNELADGVQKLADGVASGADKIPSYSESDRENLAKVVASPIDTTGLDELVTPTLSWASLLLVMALWLGALATYASVRAIDARNAHSSASNGRLLTRSLTPGLAIVGGQAVLLTALGAAVLGLEPMRIAGLLAVMLLAEATFVVANHALAAWFGASGRVASFALLLLTVVSALASSAPGIVGDLAGLSPVTPALTAVRQVATGHPATVAALGLVGWLLLALGASAVAVARSRTVSVKALLAS